MNIKVKANYDERTQFSDEELYNPDSDENCHQKEILSGRSRFLSVDNVEDVKPDFGLKTSGAIDACDKSEKTGISACNSSGNNISKFLNLNDIDNDCQISVSGIPEKRGGMYDEQGSSIELSSSHSSLPEPRKNEFPKTQNTGCDQKRTILLTESELEIEQEEIYISDPYDATKSTNKGSASSCGGMSSVEAQPFYPRKQSGSTFGATSDNDHSEETSFYNQIGSIKDQIHYQTKFLPNQKFKRVYKVD